MIFKKKWLTVPNILTTSRLILVLPFIFFLLNNEINHAFITLILMYLTELDGTIARKFKTFTDYGEFFDFIIDEISSFFILIVLLFYRSGFTPLVIILLALNILLIIVLRFNHKKSEVHNKISKLNWIKGFGIHLTILSLLFNFVKIYEFFLHFTFFSIIMLIFSFAMVSVERHKPF